MTSLKQLNRWLPPLALVCWGSAASAASLQQTQRAPGVDARSGDAYVEEHHIPGGVRWHFGTALAERRVEFTRGHLSLVSLKDRRGAYEYVQGPSDVLDLLWHSDTLTGRGTTWVLDGATTTRLAQGELWLRLKLHTADVAVVKHYLIYPEESIVQEWLTVTNRSGHAVPLGTPASLSMQVLQHDAPDVELTYMTGGTCSPGSWVLRRQPLVQHTTFTGSANADYAPIQAYLNGKTHNGLFVGWDYLGAWSSDVGPGHGSPVHIDFRVASYNVPLAPGDSVETPKAFTGVFRGDLDDLSHELFDYQYRYKWDYTRAPYFPAVRLLGKWYTGSSWNFHGVPGSGKMDPVTTYRKVFHVADLMRSLGGDVYWRDNGWWDNEGDWNGPDFGETGRYLRLSEMRQAIYIPIYDADDSSRVARAHPDWIRGHSVVGSGFLDQSQPAVIDWERAMLESRQRLWGDFEWRKDWWVTGDDPDRLLGQDQGFRRLLRTFLDRNPGMSFHGCDGGGNDLGYEMLRMAVVWQMSDGVPCREPHQVFGVSYLFPPDKLQNNPDDWDPGQYDKARWRGLLSQTFGMTGDAEDPERLEGVRLLIDIYHYLVHKGVAGRWVWVYHPAVQGDSTDYYLERLSRDHLRGVITLWRSRKTPVTIYPKGLLPDSVYTVSYQESDAMERRPGSDLMAHGIALSSVPDGEVIYLNLPLHPGSRGDHTPPTPPSHVTQQVATHMDVSGVELTWQPGHDDNWVSYYQIYRDGVPIAKVAKGTYYFDHSLHADLAAHYAVAAVDGSSNVSPPAAATGSRGEPALVADDTSPEVHYGGSGWEYQTHQWSVASGTQAKTRTPGDSVTYTFDGTGVSWYGRMGVDQGIAAVYLDGVLDRVVDTYDGDSLANVLLYSRLFPRPGHHTLKLVATGKHSGPELATEAPSAENLLKPGAVESGASTPTWIVIDGFQVTRSPQRVVSAWPGHDLAYHGTGWRHADTAQTSGARSDHAGDAAVYTFTGSGITWVGRRCAPCGMADVYVDGRLETTVDQYTQVSSLDSTLTGKEQRDVPIFTKRWATRGRHTFKIVVRPDANLWATGRAVFLDALYVEP